MSGPVRYRQAGTDVWLDGALKNISHSGVLFVGSVLLAERTWVEIELDMPPEIVGGSAARRVKCAAEIIRTEPGERGTIFGAQILDYDFVEDARS